MTVKLRYKEPDGDASRLISVPVANRTGELAPNVGFAAAVAEFGMLLRNSEHQGHRDLGERAASSRGASRRGCGRLSRGVRAAARPRGALAGRRPATSPR